MNIEEALQSLERQTAKMAQAQYNQEIRLARVEEGFRQVAETHQALVQLVSLHEERLDAANEALGHTDGRLDALVDAQIDFSERLAQLAAAQAEDRKRAGERGRLLDEKLAKLAEAQARAAEQIALLIGRQEGPGGA